MPSAARSFWLRSEMRVKRWLCGMYSAVVKRAGAAAPAARSPAKAQRRTSARGLRRLRRAQVRLNDVVDEGEVACLLAVAVDRRAPAGEACGDEPRNDRRVLARGILAGTVDVEVAQGHRREAVGAAHHQAELLLVLLGDRIH